MNCEFCQIRISDAVYDDSELPNDSAVKAHLADCTDCSEYLRELESSIASLRAGGISNQNYSDIPRRAELDSLWEELQPALDKIDAERFRQLPKKRVGAIAGSLLAVAASLVIFVGVLQQPDPEIAKPAVADNSVNPEVMNYLDRAQIMLLQVANASAPQAMDIPLSQTFARDMALEASFLNSDDNFSVNSGQKKLLKDIEFMLTQIANLDQSNAALGVDLLQRFLEEKNILFKIRLLELREQQNLI